MGEGSGRDMRVCPAAPAAASGNLIMNLMVNLIVKLMVNLAVNLESCREPYRKPVGEKVKPIHPSWTRCSNGLAHNGPKASLN